MANVTPYDGPVRNRSQLGPAQENTPSVAAFGGEFRLYQWKEIRPQRISSGERQLTMRHILNVIVVASVAFLFGAPHARAWTCSDASLKGGYGYTGTGALLAAYVGPTDAGPFAEVGRQTFDGKGHTEAAATLSANGDISQVTIEGTYTVKPDCTGTMTLNVVQFGSTVDLNIVIDEDGNEIRAIVSDANVIESRVYRKQFPSEKEERVSFGLTGEPLKDRESKRRENEVRFGIAVTGEWIGRDFLQS